MAKNYRSGPHIVGGHGTVLQKMAPLVDIVGQVNTAGVEAKISLGPINPKVGGPTRVKVTKNSGYATYSFIGSGKQIGTLRGDDCAIDMVLTAWAHVRDCQLILDEPAAN